MNYGMSEWFCILAAAMSFWPVKSFTICLSTWRTCNDVTGKSWSFNRKKNCITFTDFFSILTVIPFEALTICVNLEDVVRGKMVANNMNHKIWMLLCHMNEKVKLRQQWRYCNGFSLCVIKAVVKNSWLWYNNTGWFLVQ